MTPFSLFEAGVAIVQLVLLALLCRIVHTGRHQCVQPELRVHVPELAEVAYSLNAMRTHLYQIGRALRHRRSRTLTPNGSFDGDAFEAFFDAEKKRKTEAF
jgi:hypothetical protein